MGFFPAKNGIGGAVVCGEGCPQTQPVRCCTLIGGKDLDVVLSKIEACRRKDHHAKNAYQ